MANSAVINELHVTKPIVTQRGDIAYHFKLNKEEHDLPLEEGDIVGFFDDPDGKSHIEKLTHFNTSKAKMAGVITRSAYLEAKAPVEDKDKGKDGKHFEEAEVHPSLASPLYPQASPSGIPLRRPPQASPSGIPLRHHPQASPSGILLRHPPQASPSGITLRHRPQAPPCAKGLTPSAPPHARGSGQGVDTGTNLSNV